MCTSTTCAASSTIPGRGTAAKETRILRLQRSSTRCGERDTASECAPDKVRIASTDDREGGTMGTTAQAGPNTVARTAILASADVSFRQRVRDALTDLRWQVREAAGGADTAARLDPPPAGAPRLVLARPI